MSPETKGSPETDKHPNDGRSHDRVKINKVTSDNDGQKNNDSEALQPNDMDVGEQAKRNDSLKNALDYAQIESRIDIKIKQIEKTQSITLDLHSKMQENLKMWLKMREKVKKLLLNRM